MNAESGNKTSPLRRSKSSLHSLHSLSSLSTGSSSHLGEKYTGGISTNISFSSSVSLQGMASSSSLNSMKPRLQRQASSMSSGTFSVESATTPNETVGIDKGSNIVQWAVLLALVSQLPNLLDEIRLIVDLHYHGFPLLVFLGSFPSLLKRPKKLAYKRASRDEIVPKGRGLSINLFDHHRTKEEERPKCARMDHDTVPNVSISLASTGDDWGHFAELDASLSGFERNVNLSTSRHSTTLTTLLEEAEDEE